VGSSRKRMQQSFTDGPRQQDMNELPAAEAIADILTVMFAAPANEGTPQDRMIIPPAMLLPEPINEGSARRARL
jgi:hypothetical protein